MNKYGFDLEEIDFDLDDLIERLEKERGRMIVRIPKMTQTAPFVYEFFAIFSDFSLLEAKMVVIPRITHDGFEASVQVHGVYL
jgi:tRNA A37 methylthiotransferase MiaB